MNAKQIVLLAGLVFLLCVPLGAQKRKAPLRLTEEDKRAIMAAVFADGFEELNTKLGGSSVLDDCQDLILGNKTVAFISTKNIEPKVVPAIANVHFEFMAPGEIEAAVKANDKHCYFEFSNFEVVGPKVVVVFGKFLKRPVQLYGEAFRYEYTKVAGKWKGKYIGKTSIKS